MIFGSLDPWADSFPDALVGDVIALLLDGWQQVRPFQGWPIEDQITRAFVVQLRRAKKSRKLPFSVHEQYELVDAVTGEVAGRIDLCVMHGHDEEVYLAFECKRLNVPTRAGKVYRRASEYVTQGMTRFIRDQYRGDVGGMVGYVLDRDVSGALLAVERSVSRHARTLFLDAAPPPLSASTCSAVSSVRLTSHTVGARHCLLHHVFLPWP